MTSDPKKDRLACIDEFIISEILDTLDAEILSEIADEEIDEAKRRFEQVKLAAGRQRFEEIKAAIGHERASGSVRSFDRAKAQSELKRILESDGELRGKLTMAARNFEGEAEDDTDGMLEDLAELDADAKKQDGQK